MSNFWKTVSIATTGIGLIASLASGHADKKIAEDAMKHEVHDEIQRQLAELIEIGAKVEKVES